MCSVKTQFASQGVHNKKVMAKEGKVKEVLYEGEGNGREQDSNNIPEGMDLHFTYFCHENVLKYLLCREVVRTNRNDCCHFTKPFIIKA